MPSNSSVEESRVLTPRILIVEPALGALIHIVALADSPRDKSTYKEAVVRNVRDERRGRFGARVPIISVRMHE